MWCTASFTAEDVSHREAAQKGAKLQRLSFARLRCLPLINIPRLLA